MKEVILPLQALSGVRLRWDMKLDFMLLTFEGEKINMSMMNSSFESLLDSILSQTQLCDQITKNVLSVLSPFLFLVLFYHSIFIFSLLLSKSLWEALTHLRKWKWKKQKKHPFSLHPIIANPTYSINVSYRSCNCASSDLSKDRDHYFFSSTGKIIPVTMMFPVIQGGDLFCLCYAWPRLSGRP